MMEQQLSLDDVKAVLLAHAKDWAGMPLSQLASTGTDNALYRLGDDYLLRIPKRESAVKPLEKELVWLPKLKQLPLKIPDVIFHAKTTQDIGFDFGIFKWEKGQIATPDRIADWAEAVKALARFLAALHQQDTDGAPKAGRDNHHRGVDLVRLSDATFASIDVLADEIDATSARELWKRSCAAKPARKSVWIHGDLKADNLLADSGALTALIDWGLAAIGDPAVDYAAAWAWIEPEWREEFLSLCDITDDDRHRAEGWALYSAVIALSYYRGRSHAPLCEQSRRTLKRLELR